MSAPCLLRRVAALPSLFPYAARPGQAELVAFLRSAADEGRHAVVESGTGTGKTVSVLAAALSSARATGRRVVYLTRTHSQARQVLVEARALADKAGERLPALAPHGRPPPRPPRAAEPGAAGEDGG